MPVLSVIGTQWGDEGKGKILDMLAEGADVVVRYQGGANAGHTVVVDGERYAFSLLPSGVLYPDKRNVLASGMVIDPAQLLQEIEGLGARGIDLSGRLFVSSSAHLVFPYHKAVDQAGEAKADHGRKIGTTGRGIGPAYADKARRTGIRVGDLYQPQRFSEQLRANVDWVNQLLTKLLGAEPLSFDEIHDEAREHAERLRPFVADTFHLLQDAMDAGEQLFLEGAQGMLLDLDFGTYPYVTSSNASALGISAGTGLHGRCIDEVIGVVKAYCSRVGEGPFPTELHDEIGERLQKQGHEFGTVTGRPRRCGWLDGVALRFAARVNGIDRLALTKLDTLAGFDEVKVCVAYEVDGKRVDRFPVGTVSLDLVQPVYETLPGWSEDLGDCRERSELPAAASDYVSFVTEQVGVPVGLISVGPGRDQTIRC